MSGALFAWAGNVGASTSQYSASHSAAHGAAGCVSSVAGGGKCGHGAAAAAFGKFVTVNTEGIFSDTVPGHLAHGIVATVSGCISSMLAGGEFKDGARTAAFGYLFNEMQNRIVEGSTKSNASTSSCTAQVYDEPYHYTGETKANWNAIDWDSGEGLDVPMPLGKRINEKAPGSDISVKFRFQAGELLHEVRADRVYHRFRIENNIMQTYRVPGEIAQGSEFRWVSDPSGLPYRIGRPNGVVCINGWFGQVRRD